MENHIGEKPAILVIDMVKDNFVAQRKLPITPLALKIINPINRLTKAFRSKDWHVVFATDAFHKQDFIFKEAMKPHLLAGTASAEIIEELDREDGDLWIPKPRFSAFSKTSLAQWLRERGISLCAVGY